MALRCHCFSLSCRSFAEGSPGCNPPDIRVTKPRRHGHSQTTTSSPILTFETTQIYLPDDFSTGDLEFINHNKDAIKAAFRTGNGELLVDDVGIHEDLSLHYVSYSPTYTWNDEKKNFEHSKDPIKRTRRAALTFPSSSILKLRKDIHGVLTISEATAADNGRNAKQRRRRSTAAKRSLTKSDYEVERIYIQSTDLVSSLQQSPAAAGAAVKGDYEDNQIRTSNRTNDDNDGNGNAQSSSLQNASGTVFARHPKALMAGTDDGGGEDIKASGGESNKETPSTGGGLRRVKRKSGKTTGALSRPKSDSGSSSSKSTSRKTQCKY